MSGWDNDTTGGGDWNGGGAKADDGWNDGGNAVGLGDDAADAGGVHEATNGGDFTCRRCGESGHMARQCPSAPEGSGNDGKCFNCGGEGHSKADCPNPRVFTGTCRLCDKQGHPAALCPDKPAPRCFNCKEEGHETSACTSKRLMDTSDLPEMDAEAAWDMLQKADKDRDLDDFRTAFQIYSKASPEATYEELEHAFRNNNFNVYLIATEKELPVTHTFVSLQGDLDKKYQVGFYLSPKPKRKIQAAGWPESPEVNSERLTDAGVPMERGIPKCMRCNELGHTTRGCPEEAFENPDKVEVKCVNCDEVGHRARDCTKARQDRFACRNCKQSGHSAAECTEPRSAEGVECRKCNEVGHFSKDCPTGGGNACRNCGEEGHVSKECDKPRNPATVTCRNCEQMGHFSKDCPLPRDYSKVKCSNCDEMGHTKVRCTQPAKEADTGFGDGYGAGSGGGYDSVPVAGEGGGDWAPVATDPIAVGGGSSW